MPRSQRPVVVGGVTQTIVQDLGAGIVTGQFADAPFPTESALCARYGAARTVLREAVKMLTAKGLITSRPRTGIRIAPEDNWNLLDADVLDWLLERKFSLRLLVEFTQIRLAVEPGAAALAAIAATDSDKNAIRDATMQMYIAEREADDLVAAEIGFHVAILQASNNRFLTQMRELIATGIRFRLRRNKGARHASARDHEGVAKLILASDAEGASDAMRRLIQRTLDLMQTGANKETAPSSKRE